MSDDPAVEPTPDQPTLEVEPDHEPDTPEPGSEAEELGRIRAENARLKREAGQRERERRAAEKTAKDAADQRKAEQGEWQKLAEERAARITELEGEIGEIKADIVQQGQRTSVEALAESLHFRRPKRAYAVLVDELGGPEKAAETLADEQLTRAALSRLAKQEPELVDQTRRTGAPVNGGGGGGKQDPAKELNFDLSRLLGGERL